MRRPLFDIVLTGYGDAGIPSVDARIVVRHGAADGTIIAQKGNFSDIDDAMFFATEALEEFWNEVRT